MASPVKAAKLHHQGRGFTEVAGRGRGHLLSRKPGTEQYALTTQVGGVGWHKGQGPFTEADEIDTAWVASGGLWDWEMTQADYQAYIRDSVPVSYRYVDDATGLYIELTAGAPIWVNDQGQSQNAASFSQVTPATVDDTLTWANIAPGWSLRVQAQTARLAKFLDIDTLASLGAPTIGGTNERLRLPFTYTKSSGLTIWVDGVQWDEKNNTSVQTSGDIEFRNGATPVYWIKRPAAWDANANEAPIIQRVRRTGVNFYIEVDVPWAWLQGAIYPVTIDPTIDDSVDTGNDDGYTSSQFTTYDRTGALAYLGNEDGAAIGDADSFFLFGTISGLSGATITAASFTCVVATLNGTATKVNIYAEDAVSPASYANYNAHRNATRTTAFVTWDDETSGGTKTSGDISSVIQELADSYDPSTIMILLDNDGSASGNGWRIRTYEGSASWGADLHIEYTAAGGGRTTKNTVSNPLGLSTAIGWRIRPA